MPLKNYGVLKGRPVDIRFATSSNNHYQVHVVDDEADYRIAVNVQSKDGSELKYVAIDRFDHPILDVVAPLPLGFSRLKPTPAEGLDFIRGNLFDREKMVKLPPSAIGPDNDLNEKIDHFMQRALADEDALIYAFGERWPESGQPKGKDKIFGFAPDQGIHDIHMNQGNRQQQFLKDNGVWQDGALMFHFPHQDQWVAVFLKFQGQAWHTDDKTGHALGGEPGEGGAFEPDGMVRIVAALVNDTKSPERETVTILNTGVTAIDLRGWQLADKNKQRMALAGQLESGATITVTVKAPMQLSNQGGIITILNDDGLKVDGVSYTRQQAKLPGHTLVFR